MTNKKLIKLLVVLVAVFCSLLIGGGNLIKSFEFESGVNAGIGDNNYEYDDGGGGGTGGSASVWDGIYPKLKPSGYTISQEDGKFVFEISDAAGFAYFAYTMNNPVLNFTYMGEEKPYNNYSGMTVKLMTNINLNDEEWQPIGEPYANSYFSGIFDGNNKKISNINIKSDYYAADFTGEWYGGDSPTLIYWEIRENRVNFGLFTQLGDIATGSVIKNLTINGREGVREYHSEWALFGYNKNFPISNLGKRGSREYLDLENYKVGLLTGLNYGTIENCHVESFQAMPNASIGGLVGYNANTITNCTAQNLTVHDGDIYECDDYAFGWPVKTGGIWGDNISDFAFSYAGINNIGGIAGVNTKTISNCSYIGSNLESKFATKDYATKGGTREENYSIGGIAGKNETGSATISDCIVKASLKLSTVETNWKTGNSVNVNIYAGGIVGQGAATNCVYSSSNSSFSAVSVKWNDKVYANYVGGITGSGSVTNCAFIAPNGKVSLDSSGNDGANRDEKTYVGGLAGSGDVNNSYFYGKTVENVYNSYNEFVFIIVVDGQYCGGLTGTGTVNNSVFYGNIYSGNQKSDVNVSLSKNYYGALTASGTANSSYYNYTASPTVYGTPDTRKNTQGDIITIDSPANFFKGNATGAIDGGTRSLMQILNRSGNAMTRTAIKVEFKKYFTSNDPALGQGGVAGMGTWATYTFNIELSKQLMPYDYFVVPYSFLKLMDVTDSENNDNFKKLSAYTTIYIKTVTSPLGDYAGWYNSYTDTIGFGTNGSGTLVYNKEDSSLTAYQLNLIGAAFTSGSSNVFTLYARFGVATQVTFDLDDNYQNGANIIKLDGTWHDSQSIIDNSQFVLDEDLKDLKFYTAYMLGYIFEGWYIHGAKLVDPDDPNPPIVANAPPSLNFLYLINEEGKIASSSVRDLDYTYLYSSVWSYTATSTLTLKPKFNKIDTDFKFDLYLFPDGLYEHQEPIPYILNNSVELSSKTIILSEQINGFVSRYIGPYHYTGAIIEWRVGSIKGDAVDKGSSFASLGFTAGGNNRLYGILESDKTRSLSIKYNNNDGTGSAADTSDKMENEVALTTSVFSKANYTFVGWSLYADRLYSNKKDQNGEYDKYFAPDATVKFSYYDILDGADLIKNKNSENPNDPPYVTLYAVYQQNLTFDATGGTVDGAASKTVAMYFNHNYANVPFDLPIKQGNILNYGWYTWTSGGDLLFSIDGNNTQINPDIASYTTGTKWTRTGTVVTVYAQWTTKEYTLTYKYWGNLEQFKPNYLSESDLNKLGGNYKPIPYGSAIGDLHSPEIKHATFAGWQIDGVNINSGTIWNYDSNKDAVAVWTLKDYYINATLNGGSLLETDWTAVETDVSKYKINLSNLGPGSAVSLPAPTKNGYQFVGWYDNAECTGTPINSIPISAETHLKNYNIYAKWQAKEYNVTIMYYNLNPTNGALYEWLPWGNPVPIEYDSPILNKLNTLGLAANISVANGGREYVGWYVAGYKDGENLYNSPDLNYNGLENGRINNLNTLMKNDNNLLHICLGWVYDITYQVNYNDHGVFIEGTIKHKEAGKTVKYDYSVFSTVKFSDYTVQIDTVVFHGFDLTKLNGIDPSEDHYDSFKGSTEHFAGDMEITAVFTLSNYNIKFNANRNADKGTEHAYLGSNSNTTELYFGQNPVYVRQDYDFSAMEAVCNYYNFVGWNTNPDGTGERFEKDGNGNISGKWDYDPHPTIDGHEIVLYAQYEAKQYKFVYNNLTKNFDSISEQAIYDATTDSYYQMITHYSPKDTLVATPQKTYTTTFLGWYLDSELSSEFASSTDGSVTKTKALWKANHNPPQDDDYVYNLYPKWERTLIDVSIHVDALRGDVSFWVVDVAEEDMAPWQITTLQGGLNGHYVGQIYSGCQIRLSAYDQQDEGRLDSFIGYRFLNWTDGAIESNPTVLSVIKECNVDVEDKELTIYANHTKIEYSFDAELLFNSVLSSVGGKYKISNLTSETEYDFNNQGKGVIGDRIKIEYSSNSGYKLLQWDWAYKTEPFGTDYAYEFEIDLQYLKNVYTKAESYDIATEIPVYQIFTTMITNYKFDIRVTNSTNDPNLNGLALIYNSSTGVYTYGDVQFKFSITDNGNLYMGRENVYISFNYILGAYQVRSWSIKTLEHSNYVLRQKPSEGDSYKLKITANLISACVYHYSNRLPTEQDVLIPLEVDITREILVSFVGPGGTQLSGGIVGVDTSGSGTNLRNPYTAYYGEAIKVVAIPTQGQDAPTIVPFIWFGNNWQMLEGAFVNNILIAVYDKIRFEVTFPLLTYTVNISVDIEDEQPFAWTELNNSDFKDLLSLTVTTDATDINHITYGSVLTINYKASGKSDIYNFFGLISGDIILTNDLQEIRNITVRENINYVFKFVKKSDKIYVSPSLQDPYNYGYVLQGDNPGSSYVYKTGNRAETTEIELVTADNFIIEFYVNAGYAYYGYQINGTKHLKSSSSSKIPVYDDDLDVYMLNFENFTLEQAGVYLILFTKIEYKLAFDNDSQKGQVLNILPGLDKKLFMGYDFSFQTAPKSDYRYDGYTIGTIEVKDLQLSLHTITIDSDLIAQAVEIDGVHTITVAINYVNLYRIITNFSIPEGVEEGVEITAKLNEEPVDIGSYFEDGDQVTIEVKILDAQESSTHIDYRLLCYINNISGIRANEMDASYAENKVNRIFTLNMDANRALSINISNRIYYVAVTNQPDDESGTISGTSGYKYNQQATLSVVANDGYRFKNWTHGENNVVSENSTYKFDITDYILSYDDIETYTTLNEYGYEIVQILFTANYSDVFMVTVDFEATTLINEEDIAGTVTGGGGFEADETTTIKAVAAQGYKFEGWKVNDGDIDYTLTSEFVYTVEESDIIFTAVFSPIEYSFDTTDLQNYFDISFEQTEQYYFGENIDITLTKKDGVDFVPTSLKIFANAVLVSNLQRINNGNEWTLQVAVNAQNFNVNSVCVLTVTMVELKQVDIIINYEDAIDNLNITFYGTDYDENNNDLSYLVPVYGPSYLNSVLYFTASNNQSYEFDRYEIDGLTITNRNHSLQILDNCTVYVYFKKALYDIELMAKVDMGSGVYSDLIYNISAFNAAAYSDELLTSPTNQSAWGEIVYPGLLTTPFGYIFKEFIFNDEVITDYFAMPDEKAIIYVIFIKDEFAINFTAEHATVTGSGDYKIGDKVMLRVTPATGYEVKSWQFNTEDINFEASSYYTLVKGQNFSYISFTFVPNEAGEFNYLAVVGLTDYTLYVNTSNVAMGTVEVLLGSDAVGETNAETGQVTFNQAQIGQVLTLSATVLNEANDVFLHWERNSAILSQNRNYTLNIADISSIGTYRAMFQTKINSLRVLVSPAAAYSNEDIKLYVDGTEKTLFTEGDEITAIITPDKITKGYTFAGWHQHSITATPDETEFEYIFTMTSELIDSVLILQFVPTKYNFNFISITNNTPNSTDNSVGGTIYTIPSSADKKFDRLNGLTLEMTPNEGYIVEKIEFKLGSQLLITVNPENYDSYALTDDNFDAIISEINNALTERVDVIVYYKIIAYTVKAEYAIILGNQSINPAIFNIGSGGVAVDYDGTATISFTIEEGFRFVGWSWQKSKFDQIAGSTSDFSYKITNVKQDMTIYAHFEYIPYYIQPKANDVKYGTVSGGGRYYTYDSVTLNATAYKGYYLSHFEMREIDPESGKITVIRTVQGSYSWSFTFLASMAEYEFVAVFMPYKVALEAISGRYQNGEFKQDTEVVYGAVSILGGTPEDDVIKFEINDNVTLRVITNHGYLMEYFIIGNKVYYPELINQSGESFWQYEFVMTADLIMRQENGVFYFNVIYSLIKFEISYDYNLSSLKIYDSEIVIAIVDDDEVEYKVASGGANNAVVKSFDYLTIIKLRANIVTDNNFENLFEFKGFYLNGQFLSMGNAGDGFYEFTVTQSAAYMAVYMPKIAFKNFDSLNNYERIYDGEGQIIGDDKIECDSFFKNSLVILYNGLAILPVNVGTYALQVYVDIGVLNNYKMVAGNANLVIKPKELTIGYVSETISKVYDGTPNINISSIAGGLRLYGLVEAHNNKVSLDSSAAIAKITSGGFEHHRVKNGCDLTIFGLKLKGDSSIYSNYLLMFTEQNEKKMQFNSKVNITPKQITLYGLEFVSKVYDGNDSVTLSGSVPSLKDFELIALDIGKVGIDLSKITFKFENSAIGQNKRIIVTVNSDVLIGLESENYKLNIPAKFASIHPYEILYQMEGVGEFKITDINKNVFLPINGVLQVFAYNNNTEQYRDIYRIVQLAIGRYREFNIAYAIKIYANGVEYQLNKQVQVTISTDFQLKEGEIYVYNIFGTEYSNKDVTITDGKIIILTDDLETYALLTNKNILTITQIILIVSAVLVVLIGITIGFVTWRRKRKQVVEKYGVI